MLVTPRESMEDAHTVMMTMDGHSNAAFFAVFDGHCGKQAAHWCEKNVAKSICRLKEFNTKEIQVWPLSGKIT